MGQKQIVTRKQIAKMAGTDVTHFLNQCARFVAKSLGDQAGLKNVRVHLINLPVGAVALAFHRHAGQSPDLVDIAAVSQPRLSDHLG